MSEYEGYKIKCDGTFGMVSIVTIGPGSVPMPLKGCFTSVAQAQKAIDIFLIEKAEKKVNKNGKANSSSRD